MWTTPLINSHELVKPRLMQTAVLAALDLRGFTWDFLTDATSVSKGFLAITVTSYGRSQTALGTGDSVFGLDAVPQTMTRYEAR